MRDSLGTFHKRAQNRAVQLGTPIATAFGMAGFRDFRILKRPQVVRDFKFRDQLLDCSRSATRNIAEGFARFKHKEFAQFVRVAKGSMGEVLDHFADAVDNGYLSLEEFPRYEHACKKALLAINGPYTH